MSRADLIARFYAAYNAHDAAAAAALYADDASHTEAASGRSRTGRAAIKRGLAGFLGMLDDLRLDPGARVHAGDHSLVFYRMRGRMTRAIGPHPARGQEIALDGVHRFVLRDGMIVETHDYWDEAAFMAQIAA